MVRHDVEAEREMWNRYAAAPKNNTGADREPVFEWTQWGSAHGPGIELLGAPVTVLDLGSGPGREAAYLAARGMEVTGIDLSPVMVEAAAKRWAATRELRFVCAEVITYLSASTKRWDAIYSSWGAVWFTDPEALLPLIAGHLSPGGRFVAAHAPAIPGAYGPQGTYGDGFKGRAHFHYRYAYTPRRWLSLMGRAGLVNPAAEVVPAPAAADVGTLLLTAQGA
ncbi:class I SAM-dependent methyltransferase [Streptomyces sp. YC504]|uniref:Class I SAM-dependent methyltransferase n=1 Tax=Streptomyces mesophilus TaxID=1775132 RepID=A0A6G4XWQ1_9ACTN|nr:class I SAM-dependent methyltransferase [Streptomyces mesophilus]NGO81653.1 class I SAM-dependent methyltransferase [Streptomyces mesophilus]